MSWRPHPRRTILDINNPDPWATSDRSGFIGNLSTLKFQWQYAGPTLINTGLMVNPDELDKPNEQFRTIVIPPDPNPLMNARPEPYVIDETDWLTAGTRGQGGAILNTQDESKLVTQPSATQAETESTN